jgi:RNA polymerase sigma-70 factor (ECF subfamily)
MESGEQVVSMDMEMELLTPNDGDLEAWVALARRRDQIGQRAFEHLFWYYQGAIGTYLAHLVQHEEIARDLAQDTFVAAWQALPQFTGETHFRAWLYRIATNKAYTYLHRQRRQPISLEALLEQEEGGAEALLAQGGQWEDQLVTSELISQVLATLSPRSRTCLLLQDAVGCSQREIAQILGISEQTVAAYVSRARESFRQRYRQMEAAVQAPGGQAHSTPD